MRLNWNVYNSSHYDLFMICDNKMDVNLQNILSYFPEALVEV